MIQVQKLTAEVLLAAPRRSAAIPNHNGRLALYDVSTHKFGDKTVKEVRVIDLQTRQSSDPGTNHVLMSNEHSIIAEFDGPIEYVKLKKLDDGSVVFMVTGQVGDDGLLYNQEAHQKPSTGRTFDSARIRLASLENQQPYSLWYNKLQQGASGKWELAGHLLNLVDNNHLDIPGSMLDVDDPPGTFDISHRGAVFIAQDRTILDPGEFAPCYSNLVTRTWDNGDDEQDPPKGFEFAGDAENIIMASAKFGRTVLSRLRLRDGETPHILFKQGTASAFYPLKDGQWDDLLVSSSSFVDSSLWQVVNVSDAAVIEIIPLATKAGIKYGLAQDMITEFWNFDEIRSTLLTCWWLKWNMAAWAEQGYIITCPNITGRVGYGREFARRINGEWGGRAFQDLLNLIIFLEKLPYLAQDKAVLAGASYSGYMVSWMLGHEIINKFCCAIWHDGIFNLSSFFLQTDVLYESGNFEGALYPWQRPNAFERFNPARPKLLRNWRNAPPTLVIHSEKDYRCPITEGIATYNTIKGNGVPSRFLIFPNEGHWVLDPENSLVWHNTVWDWVNKCVSGNIKRGDMNW
ncbi:hypothetical protein ED733_003518 [Metarhizium rileyi]|uniref:Dipeptidyl-peptidase V n=1 Tax=Metarhizium rileyi (strain RCEF 4871) TaxID=1649241 RepID=A0A5C6G8Z0_METRR|nr:hypothetical protein ED733_003518 [Metarhizium rileyi]